MLVEISRELKDKDNQKDSLRNIYRYVTEKVSSILNTEIISIFIFEEQLQVLKSVAEYRAGQGDVGSSEEYEQRVGLTGRVFHTGEIIKCSSLQSAVLARSGQSDDLSIGYEEERVSIGDIPSGELRHYLGVPIRRGERVIGVIRAINKKSQAYTQAEPEKGPDVLLPRGFSEDCETELEIAASHLAVAIQNAELVNTLHTINDIGRKISSVDIDDLLKQIVKLTAEFINADICLLFLRNESGNKFVLSEAHGMLDGSLKGAFYHFGEGKTGGIAKTGKPILESRAEEAHKGKYEKEILFATQDGDLLS